MEPKTIYIGFSLAIVALVGVIVYLMMRNTYPSCLGTKGKWNEIFKNDKISSIKNFLKLVQLEPNSKIVFKDTCASCVVDIAEQNYEPKDFQENFVQILATNSVLLLGPCKGQCVEK